MTTEEDYSLTSMEIRMRAADGGKPLTPEQRAEVQRLHDEYHKTLDALKAHLAKVEAERDAAKVRADDADKAFQRFVAEIIERRQAKKPAPLSDAAIDFLDKQADAARARLKARGFPVRP